MKSFRYTYNSLLGILQQAEYDPVLFREWAESFHVLPSEHLTSIQPERWTAKLKIISSLGKVFRVFLPNRYAILLALQIFLPFEQLARLFFLWKARRKLRKLQENGLTVIAVAGSFGKTSTKHLLAHTLRGSLHVHASEGSFNTPLGLASSINQLTSRHDVFLAELGEYKEGDIAELLELIRPEIGILTPIGFAHEERFGTSESMNNAFAEMWTSAFAPEMLIVSDANRDRLSPPENTYWYGSKKESHLSLRIRESTLEGTQGTLTFSDSTTLPFRFPLAGASLAENTLPGILLMQFFEQPMDITLVGNTVVQPISRRLELHKNLNGTKVVDNSYNTNPAAWKHSYALLKKLEGTKAVLTPGFVELTGETTHSEHLQMARNLHDLGATIGVVRTRFNETLIDELTKHLPPEKLIIGYSYDELLEQLRLRGQRFETLWLEGGVRELYQ